MSDKVYWKAGPLYLELLRRWKQMTKTACSLTGSMSHRSSSGRFLMIYLLFESHRTVWDFSWNLFFWRNHQSFLVMRSNYIEFCRKQKTVWMKPNIQAESFLDAPKNSKRWEQHQHTEWPQITSEGFFFFFFCRRARSCYWSLLLKEQWGVLRLWRWRRKLALRNDRLLYEQGRLSQFHYKAVLHWIIVSMKMNHAEIRQVICYK